MQLGMCEYLVNHGKSGAIGRFVAATPLTLVRGDRVVVRSQRGLEMGVVMCPANARQARLLGSVLVGELLRPANGDDLTALELLRPLTQKLFDDSRQLIRDLALPAEIIDVEVLLDGRRAILQHLQAAECAWDAVVRRCACGTAWTCCWKTWRCRRNRKKWRRVVGAANRIVAGWRVARAVAPRAAVAGAVRRVVLAVWIWRRISDSCARRWNSTNAFRC